MNMYLCVRDSSNEQSQQFLPSVCSSYLLVPISTYLNGSLLRIRPHLWFTPFRYDLNQIPYDYTVEVRNRFKGLDLIDRVPDEL